MLVESSGDIDSDTCVEGVVGTEDDIDGPVHGSLVGSQRAPSRSVISSHIVHYRSFAKKYFK